MLWHVVLPEEPSAGLNVQWSAVPHKGLALASFEHILKLIYGSGFNLPCGVGHHAMPSMYSLPLPRLVSIELVATATVTHDDTYTHVLMQWGQFLDCDLDHTVSGWTYLAFLMGNCAALHVLMTLLVFQMSLFTSTLREPMHHVCFLYAPALCVVVEWPPWWWTHMPENRLTSS